MSVQAKNHLNGSNYALSPAQETAFAESVQILQHMEAHVDYQKLCCALWGTHGAQMQVDLDSDYSAGEIPKLKQKYLDLCKMNIMLSTTLGKTQKEFRLLMESVQTKIRIKFGSNPLLMAEQTAQLQSALKEVSGLIAKNQLLASYGS